MEKLWLTGALAAILLLAAGYLAMDGKEAEILPAETKEAADTAVPTEGKKEIPAEKTAKLLRAEALAVERKDRCEENGAGEEKDEERRPSVRAEDSAYLMLVNKENPIPEGYRPELIPVAGHNAAGEKRAVGALETMLKAGTYEGLRFVVCSGYRTEDDQRKLYLNQIQKKLAEGFRGKEAVAEAEKYSALPGHSEHESGLAFDIVALSYQNLDDGFASTGEALWLREHAASYGFILRYPADKEAVTGIGYEPWHFRYVGTAAAVTIARSGLTLEEYLTSCGD